MSKLALFNTENILPFGGELIDYGILLNPGECRYYLEKLLTDIAWKHDEAFIFGRHITTKRQYGWYGDMPFPYTYSNKTRIALPWTKDLLALKSMVEVKCGAVFNACLLNLYPTGKEGMAWHSDDERELGRNPVIASLSLGAERRFSLKHKVQEKKISMSLAAGSLIVMRGSTQRNWLHSLPKSSRVDSARINLTFRNMERPTTPSK